MSDKDRMIKIEKPKECVKGDRGLPQNPKAPKPPKMEPPKDKR